MRYFSCTLLMFALLLVPFDASAHISVTPHTEVADAGTVGADATPKTDAGDSGALAPDKAPETVEEVAELVTFLTNAAKEGHWLLFFGALLTLLVWFLEKVLRIKERAGKSALPWVGAALGVVSLGGLAILQGLSPWSAIAQGLLAGASAVGLWEMIGKHIGKKATT